MPNKILLSILIPTYNRSDCLDLNLKQLTSQINSRFEPIVEVVISDNNSSDDTKLVIEKYKKYRYIKILMAEENIGPDKNFLKLISESRGKFRWIYGDDEAFLCGGLEKIISILSNNPDIGLLHIAKNNSHLSLESFNQHAGHGIYESSVYVNANEFLKKISYDITFITANIFNYSYLNNDLIPRDFHLGTNLNQMTFYLQAILRSNRNIYLREDIYSVLYDNSGGYGLFEVFGVNFQKILQSFTPHGLSEAAIKKCTDDLLKSFFPSNILMIKVGNGGKSSSRYNKENIIYIMTKIFYGYLSFWIYCFPLLVTPAPLLKIIYKILKNTKRFLTK